MRCDQGRIICLVYQPPQFREDSTERQHALILDHPLGLLVSATGGELVANLVPFTVYPDEGQFGTLRCHVSRANHQWRDLQAAENCLVAFQGPQAYVTPSWYAAKTETGKVVPTWNYAIVQANGRPRVTEDASWLRRQLEDLTDVNEARFPRPWRVTDAPEEFIDNQIRGIVGIEIVIERLAGKWKMSQNRQLEDRAKVATGLKELGGTAAAAGDLVDRYLSEERQLEANHEEAKHQEAKHEEAKHQEQQLPENR